jgi:hypothetical protein
VWSWKIESAITTKLFQIVIMKDLLHLSSIELRLDRQALALPATNPQHSPQGLFNISIEGQEVHVHVPNLKGYVPLQKEEGNDPSTRIELLLSDIIDILGLRADGDRSTLLDSDVLSLGFEFYFVSHRQLSHQDFSSATPESFVSEDDNGDWRVITILDDFVIEVSRVRLEDETESLYTIGVVMLDSTFGSANSELRLRDLLNQQIYAQVLALDADILKENLSQMLESEPEVRAEVMEVLENCAANGLQSRPTKSSSARFAVKDQLKINNSDLQVLEAMREQLSHAIQVTLKEILEEHALSMYEDDELGAQVRTNLSVSRISEQDQPITKI